MTYRAKMHNSKVVFKNEIKPANGVELRVKPVSVQNEKPAATDPVQPSLSEVLLSFAGTMNDPSLPEDGSVNHDHYIYGAPKR